MAELALFVFWRSAAHSTRISPTVSCVPLFSFLVFLPSVSPLSFCRVSSFCYLYKAQVCSSSSFSCRPGSYNVSDQRRTQTVTRRVLFTAVEVTTGTSMEKREKLKSHCWNLLNCPVSNKLKSRKGRWDGVQAFPFSASTVNASDARRLTTDEVITAKRQKCKTLGGWWQRGNAERKQSTLTFAE